MNLFAGNTSSIHPLDYKTLPEIAEYSVSQSAGAAVKTDLSSRDAITNHHINTQRTAEAQKAGGIPWVFPNPTTLAYLLGQDILVHPVTMDVDNRTASAEVKLTFPELADVIPSTNAAQGTEWLDWWEPANAEKAHKAGETKVAVVPIDSFPVYVRKGAFIPLHPMRRVNSNSNNAEDISLDPDSQAEMDRVHFTWFGPTANTDSVTYSLRESVADGEGMVATAAYSGDTITATVSAHSGSMGAGFEFVGISEPSDVQLTYWPNSRCTHEYSAHSSTLSVSCAKVGGGLKVTVSGVNSKL